MLVSKVRCSRQAALRQRQPDGEAGSPARSLRFRLHTPAVELHELAHQRQADPVRLQQVLWNLLQNAVKFTPEGGRVTARLQRAGNEARLSIEDTGQGLEPGLLPNLFQMFRQADSRANLRHGGLGIGLALVRQLVELHGGRVEAESEGPGRGARFTVWLPLAQGGLPAAPHL